MTMLCSRLDLFQTGANSTPAPSLGQKLPVVAALVGEAGRRCPCGILEERFMWLSAL